MAENQTETRKRGRPSKGSRCMILARMPVDAGMIVKQAARARGASISDYVAAAAIEAAVVDVRGAK